MGDARLASEPDWYSVIGGPPPIEVVFRDTLMALGLPVGVIALSLLLPRELRVVVAALAVLGAGLLMLVARRRWLRQKGVRVVGNVLEYRDGAQVARLALTRAMVSAAASPPGMLVLVMDDGRTHVAVGRRAEPHELSDLPARLGPYLELLPEHFEEVRIAAHRSYPRA